MALLEPRCHPRVGVPPPPPSQKLCPAPHLHLLGGGDEIDGLQAGQRLPALVDVFHNWGGKTGAVAGTGAGRGTQLRGIVGYPTAAQDQPCPPLRVQNVPSHSPLPTLSPPQPSPTVPCLGLHAWVPGKVPGRGGQWICLRAPTLLLPRFILPSVCRRGPPGGDALAVPELGQTPAAPDTSRCMGWGFLLLAECCRELFVGLTENSWD